MNQNAEKIADQRKTLSPEALHELLDWKEFYNNTTDGSLYEGPNQRRIKEYVLANAKNKVLLIDVRYPYEYFGGHIKGAINIFHWPCLREYLFGRMNKMTEEARNQLTIVLYCEFSSKRAPAMYDRIRNEDRRLNHYPHLTYPSVYLLDGGYSAFHRAFSGCREFFETYFLCSETSQEHWTNYIKMKDFPSQSQEWQRLCQPSNLMKRPRLRDASPCYLFGNQ